jgi:hypothetical protein
MDQRAVGHHLRRPKPGRLPAPPARTLGRLMCRSPNATIDAFAHSTSDGASVALASAVGSGRRFGSSLSRSAPAELTSA